MDVIESSQQEDNQSERVASASKAVHPTKKRARKDT
ncbi:hypothetical protein PI125_g12867 [Phytophthora idaei]|nr:hypothetical protein PI125_g12867 [Phytophthora idaei]